MGLKPNPSGLLRPPAVTGHQHNPFDRIETLATGVTLQVEEGPDAGAEFNLDGITVTGGRGSGQDVCLADTKISEAHFELRLNDQGLSLRDLDSRNGTWVGRARLLGPVVLHEGASFFVGSSRIRVTTVHRGDVAVAKDDTLLGLYGQSISMRRLFALLRKLAPTPLEVLIEGETGVGKEGVARALHHLSGRGGEFVALNCGAVPRELAEGLLFGHAKGAFTGATGQAVGAFEAANRGTLFLDEVGELATDLQPKLLRVLDQKEVVRLGEHRPRPLDVRVVSATHRDLGRLVSEGQFRQDLFHRLATMRLEVPPLRERSEDIRGLAQLFLEQHADETGAQLVLSADAETALREVEWPGNVRQLKAAVRRTAYLVDGEAVTAAALRRFGAEWNTPKCVEDMRERKILPLREATAEFQREYCRHLLELTNGDLDAAAELAGYGRRGLRELLTRLDLA